MYSLLIWWIFVLTFSPYVFHVNICSCCACANRGWAKTKTKMTTSTATTTASRMTNDGKWWWGKMRQRQTHTHIHWIAFNFIFSMPFFSLHFSSFFIHFIFFCSFDHFTFCQLTKAFGCCNTRDALAISKWKYCLYERMPGVWSIVATTTTSATVQSNYTSSFFSVRWFFLFFVFHFVFLVVDVDAVRRRRVSTWILDHRKHTHEAKANERRKKKKRRRKIGQLYGTNDN